MMGIVLQNTDIIGGRKQKKDDFFSRFADCINRQPRRGSSGLVLLLFPSHSPALSSPTSFGFGNRSQDFTGSLGMGGRRRFENWRVEERDLVDIQVPMGRAVTVNPLGGSGARH